ncbi:MAG: hypothetical protein VB858_02255, partial [Planctomycetaceae bacterium]
MRLSRAILQNPPLQSAAMLLWLIGAGNVASGQSLSERLKAEPAAALAAAARQQGQAVRGAILFPQQKLGCTGCHAPGNEKLLGPDLTRLGQATTDVSLVEALLEPSRTIRKGFETVTIVTTAGKSVTGRILEQNPQTIVLRDTSPARRRIPLPRSDIEDMLPVKTSSMPDRLVDTLRDRQEFLDLVRYLMEIASTGSNRPPVDARNGETISQELQGYVLLKELHCGACHTNDVARTDIPEQPAADLSWSTGRVDPDYLQAFIANPQHVKPGTTMPDMPGTPSAAERQRVALEMTHYIASLSDRTFSVQPVDAAAAVRGHTLFHSIGCVACHSPRNDSGVELLSATSIPLGQLDRKYSINGLTDFLEQPRAARPSGRMPDLKLTHWEALDLAHFLAGRTVTAGNKQQFRPDAGLAARGRQEFERRGCVHCHLRKPAVQGHPPRSLSQVRTDRGCLSETRGAWPRFQLHPSQRQALHAALNGGRQTLNNTEQIAVTLTALRCLNCHQRGALGGISADRDPFFQTTNPNLGPQGRIPPTLTNVGARLQPKWMRQVLVRGRDIRPYVTTRMPLYGTADVEHLIDLFQHTDTLPEIGFASFADQKVMRTTGAEMAGTGGLNCIACHTFQ